MEITKTFKVPKPRGGLVVFYHNKFLTKQHKELILHYSVTGCYKRYVCHCLSNTCSPSLCILQLNIYHYLFLLGYNENEKKTALE